MCPPLQILVLFPFASCCHKIPTSRSKMEESGSLGETENHFKTAICIPPVKKTLEPIPMPKREQQTHLQEPGLVGKVRIIRPGKLTKLNQRSGAFLLPLLDFIKTTPFHLSILGNALSVLSKEAWQLISMSVTLFSFLECITNQNYVYFGSSIVQWQGQRNFVFLKHLHCVWDAREVLSVCSRDTLYIMAKM